MMATKGKIPPRFQSVKGFHDVLPWQQPLWQLLRKHINSLADDFGFGRIDLPILEKTNLFVRTSGQASDIVRKELYSFTTKGGDELSLRPEGTAGVCRAYLEHGLYHQPRPLKLWYWGPMFRYENPQAGRFRQHYQAGFEIIGDQSPALDAQVIQAFVVLARTLKLKGVSVEVNSIGCPDCRPKFQRVLINCLSDQARQLCPDCRARLRQNPLRVLDCKQEKCQAIFSQLPQIIDYLCPDCHAHFKAVLEFLEELGVSYVLNQNLVRGLDYYSKTVFEFKIGQDAISVGGGGRYDGLIGLLGGPDTPAVGMALGLERLIMALKEQGVKPKCQEKPAVFLVQLGEEAKRKSLKIFDQLRRCHINVKESLAKNSIKSQLRMADKMGIDLALILGQKEVMDSTIIIRDMSAGSQEVVRLDKLVADLKKRLSRKK